MITESQKAEIRKMVEEIYELLDTRITYDDMIRADLDAAVPFLGHLLRSERIDEARKCAEIVKHNTLLDADKVLAARIAELENPQ